MNKRSKFAGLALSATLAAGTLFTVAPAGITYANEQTAVAFSDLDPTGDDYQPILALAERGIIKGYPDGTYKPGRDITRQQAAKIIAGALELDTKNVKDPGYTDLSKDSEYYGPIAALTEAGILSGTVKDGKKVINPASNLSRAQMAKIIAEAYDLDHEVSYTAPFTDVTADEWHAGYVQALYNLGITKGVGNVYAENDFVTRGQMAMFIHRAENSGEAVKTVEAARDLIYDFLESKSEVKDNNGVVIVETAFDRETGVYDVFIDADTNIASLLSALGKLKEVGLLSEDITKLGLTHLKVADNKPVDLTKDFDAAVNTLTQQVIDEVLRDGKISSHNIPVEATITVGKYTLKEEITLNGNLKR
ncbi:Surface layer protein [Bhargavaea cecembensis DSE10]|uniref:Surface layer protein n=1 Tax=Bhargavaea cecembensis DSE10 TaxID=1235279 RepID=M7NL54_9BACL|nr:S-layer homology domain-containing protein [Bhargavaea cecembensis]EMR07932.1 Surface layer protein [Bhargavaea cecembensis DSE10]